MKRFGNEKGAALILALIVMMVLSLLSVSILTQATGRMNVTEARLTEAELVQAAEAGLDAAIIELNGHAGQLVEPTEENNGNIGVDGWDLGCDAGRPLAGDPDRIFDNVPNFDEPGVMPVSYRDIEYYTWAEYFCNDGNDNDNDGLWDTANPDGTRVDPLQEDIDEVYYVRVLVFARRAAARAAERREAVYEAILESAGLQRAHEFFVDYGVGSCNQLDIPFVLQFGGQTGASYWECNKCGFQMSTKMDCPSCGASQWWVTQVTIEAGHADRIVGDLFHDGDMKWTQGARADGTVSATGKITGNPGPDAEVVQYADPVDPPDISGMDYAKLADFVVETGSPDLITRGTSVGSIETFPEDDPRHIFAENWRTDLGDVADNTYSDGTDVPQWQLADTYDSSNGFGNISLSDDGTDKVYYIDGDLWLEGSDNIWNYCAHYMYVDDPPEGSRMTIVVKGNIYICDDFWVSQGSTSVGAKPPVITDDNKNAVAFIAVTGGQETFTDMNGNWTWDPGEPILNDDGDGVYEGPRYGSGNITYGDPNTGPVGHSQAFFYAENNFKDYCLDGNGQPLDFGITGLMSAGGLVDINRDFGKRHAEMVSVADTRLRDKLISLPGLPKGAAKGALYPVGPFEVISWRRLW